MSNTNIMSPYSPPYNTSLSYPITTTCATSLLPTPSTKSAYPFWESNTYPASKDIPNYCTLSLSYYVSFAGTLFLVWTVCMCSTHACSALSCQNSGISSIFCPSRLMCSIAWLAANMSRRSVWLNTFYAWKVTSLGNPDQVGTIFKPFRSIPTRL